MVISSQIDPLGRPTITAGCDHVASFLTFQNLAKQNKFQVRVVIATGGIIVGLAKWIIDETHDLFSLCFQSQRL